MRIKLLSLFLLILASCGKNPISIGYENLKYVLGQTDFFLEISGQPFQVSADNCGGVGASTQTTSRSQKFATQLDIDISGQVAAEFGGDIKLAKAALSRAIERTLGIKIGVETVASSSIEIPTPPGNRTITTLQWKAKWARGDISVLRPDGSSVGLVPFAVLNSLDLEQQSVETFDCITGVLISQESTPQVLPTVDSPSPGVEPGQEETIQPSLLSPEEADALLGSRNWFCLDGSPNGVGVRDMPQVTVRLPLIAVDKQDGRYRINAQVPGGGPATAWFDRNLANSECSAGGLPPSVQEVDNILGKGNWFCLKDSLNGLRVIDVPANLVVRPPLIAVDKQDRKYGRGEPVPEGGPATAWLRSDLSRYDCP